MGMGFTVVELGYETANSIAGCGVEGWFSCKLDNFCIPPSFVCDGEDDCIDASDELGECCEFLMFQMIMSALVSSPWCMCALLFAIK